VIQPDWTLEGGAQDVQLLWRVGFELANSTSFPKWKAGASSRHDATCSGPATERQTTR